MTQRIRIFSPIQHPAYNSTAIARILLRWGAMALRGGEQGGVASRLCPPVNL